MFNYIIGMIAAVFLYTLPLDNLHGRLAALYMSYYIAALGMNTATTAGYTKKVKTNALIFIAYDVAHQAPPLPTWQGLHPRHLTFYCAWENRRRYRLDPAVGEKTHRDTDFIDLTDKQNVHFRYVW